MSDARVHPEDAQEEISRHLADLHLSPRDEELRDSQPTSPAASGDIADALVHLTGDNLVLQNNATGESVDDREGVRWVDLSNTTDEARSSLGEKKMGPDVVVITDLIKEYPLADRAEGVCVLKGINMHKDSEIYAIKESEFVILRGPSGGGKSTFLNMIGTVDEPSGGRIEIFGDVIDNKCTDAYLAELRLKHIGFVFQTFNLLSTMSAYENVALPMVINGTLSEDQIRTRTLQLLAVVGLQDRAAHLPAELSGGEQQRVTIARSLANRPKLLLLDEPTGDLDTRNTIEVMDILLRINREYRTTCVMVTHNPDLECYADRIIYLEDGVIKKQSINTRQMKLDYDHYMRHIGNVYGEINEQ